MRPALFSLLFLVACNNDAPQAVPTVESLSCDTPGEEVQVPETRGVFAMRAYTAPSVERWSAWDYTQEAGMLYYYCPDGGAVEMLVY